jgi:N-sulfoglucosamine sulfohydrolase
MKSKIRANPKALVWRVFTCLLLGALSTAPSDALAKENLVVFIADDHGFLDSEVYGAKDVRTPNMRRLAQAGMTLTHCFVASPSCAPSRAALLTGLMPARNGAEANHSKPRAQLKKLPAFLRELGYEVAGFGKVAHYNHDQDYGFDHYDKRDDSAVVAEFLQKRDSSRPLCLFVGSHAPHVPWSTNATYHPADLDLPPTHVDTRETREFRAQYYTDVSKADELLGRVYTLALANLGTNTLFIYSSDHGAQWPFGKWNLYDAGTRVPMIAVWPGKIPAGSSNQALISWVDILPTLVEAAGGNPPADLDGRSFAAVLRGDKTEHREYIFATHSGDGRMNVYPIRSIRARDWKYILNPHPEFAHTTHIDLAKDRDGLKYWQSWVSAAKTNDHAARQVARYQKRPREELYDLRVDPYEQRNLAFEPAHAGQLEELRDRLERWMREQNDGQTVFARPRYPSVKWKGTPSTTNARIWGIEGNLQFALHPNGFTPGEGGPRGLIRIGYPTLANGQYDLINFIAVEPIVNGQKGFSELEKSAFDRKNGKMFWPGSSKTPEPGPLKGDAGEITSLAPGVQQLNLAVSVERFENGAHVRLKLAQRSDRPDELSLTIEAEPDSAPIESCILTATMGNKARARLLFLADGPVSSLQLYPEYRDEQFSPHRLFGLERLPLAANGDVLVAIMNDEDNPANARPFGRAHFWDYKGWKVTQYWRKPAMEIQPGLACAVNGRFTYWGGKQPIPGGISFENFELREPFRSGQTFVFGVTRALPPLSDRL